MGGPEVLVVLVVALLLFGADRLPGIARSMGRIMSQVRLAGQEFRDQLMAEEAQRPPPAKSELPDSALPAPPEGDTTDDGKRTDPTGPARLEGHGGPRDITG